MDADDELENETSADYAKLKDIVQNAVAAATKPLHQKIKGLQDIGRKANSTKNHNNSSQKNSKPTGKSPSVKKFNQKRSTQGKGTGGKPNGTSKGNGPGKKRSGPSTTYKRSKRSKQGSTRSQQK